MSHNTIEANRNRNLFGDHDDISAFAKAKELVAKNVEIAGEPANRDGIKGITVKSVKPI